jgi:ATP-binding cassette subfamily C protein
MFIFEKIKGKLNFISKLNDLFDRKDKISFLIVMAAALAMALFQAVGVASILPFINIVMNPNIISENEWLRYFFNVLDFKSVNSFVVFSGFVVLGFLIIGNLITSFATWLKINFVWKKNHTLSSALLKKYLSLPYVYFLDKNTADLGENVLAEVQQLTSGLLQPIMDIITGSMVTVVILMLLLYFNPLMTLVSAAVLISLYFLIYFYYSNGLKMEGEKRSQENVERYKSANEALSGIKDIKLLGVERFFLQSYIRHSDNFSNSQSWYQLVAILPRYVMETVAFGGVVGLMIFLIYFNKSTQEMIPLVSFFAFAGYRLMPALQDIFYSVTTFKFNKVVLNKIHRDMTERVFIDRSVADKHEGIKAMPFEKEIELRNICFSYPNNNREVLKDICLNIKKNNYVALIGSTGSGKTTLVDLILGLFAPERGTFKIDDMEINDGNIKSWQANLGYVPQQIYLSDDTIARNIAFGLPDEKIDMDQVKRVAQMANLDDFVENELSSGYNTIIGERGIRLSGGQRQRIGIARALYHDPQVLLFDEATSSLDNATEKEVLNAIEGIAKLKTMIVVAHRLTTVKNCDKVYVVEKGRIIKEGSYEEVVGNK